MTILSRRLTGTENLQLPEHIFQWVILIYPFNAIYIIKPHGSLLPAVDVSTESMVGALKCSHKTWVALHPLPIFSNAKWLLHSCFCIFILYILSAGECWKNKGQKQVSSWMSPLKYITNSYTYVVTVRGARWVLQVLRDHNMKWVTFWSLWCTSETSTEWCWGCTMIENVKIKIKCITKHDVLTRFPDPAEDL